MKNDIYVMDDKRLNRREETQEVFTPDSLLDIMCAKLSPELWTNPHKTFLDNCCGNGQIILYIIKKKINSGSSIIQALSTTYGLDIMEDNVQETKHRIINYINSLNIPYDEKKAINIINHNIVCHDALEGWDYENWCKIKKDIALPLF